LVKRELLNCYPTAEGWWEEWRDTWLFDPVATLTPDATTNKAFQRAVNNSLTAFTSPDNATTEFNATEYANVQSADGVFASHTATATRTTRYANVAHLFKFNANYADISDITCFWKGYVTLESYLAQKLQIYKASAWEDWLTTLPTTNTQYSKSIGNGAAYFYDTTWIRFGLYITARTPEPPITITLNTDYAALQITYGIVVAPKAGLPLALIATILEEA